MLSSAQKGLPWLRFISIFGPMARTARLETAPGLECPRCGGTGVLPDPRLEGAEMRQAREDAGLSLRDLAKRTGLSVGYLSDLELGRRSWREELRERILKALK